MYPEEVKREDIVKVLEALGLAEGWEQIKDIEITPDRITITKWNHLNAPPRTADATSTTSYLIRIGS